MDQAAEEYSAVEITRKTENYFAISKSSLPTALGGGGGGGGDRPSAPRRAIGAKRTNKYMSGGLQMYGHQDPHSILDVCGHISFFFFGGANRAAGAG